MRFLQPLQMDSVAVMDLFEGLNGPEQMEAANNSGQEQDAPDSGHHTSVQTSSSVASCANTVTVQGVSSRTAAHFPLSRRAQPGGGMNVLVPRTINKKALAELGGLPATEHAEHAGTHWLCTNCRDVILPKTMACGICGRPSPGERDCLDSRSLRAYLMNLQTIAYAKKLRFTKGKAQRKGKSASSGAYGLPDYKERVNADRAAYQGVGSLAERRAMMLGVHIFEFWYVQCTHARLAILKPPHLLAAVGRTALSVPKSCAFCHAYSQATHEDEREGPHSLRS